MPIPKVVHYCWFGKKAKGKLVDECIDSWEQMLPDYKLVEWNEETYSSKSFFFTECMSQKKYAFASDYARFDILKQHGGIYLDTDMLLLTSLNALIDNHCFFGYENENMISCGIIGALAHDPFIEAISKELETVHSISFFENYTIVKLVNSLYTSLADKRNELAPQIYPVDFFYPYPFGAAGDPLSYRTNNTVAIHLWSASWFNDFNRAQLLYSQGKKSEARKLYLKSLLKHPQYIRFLNKFFF